MIFSFSKLRSRNAPLDKPKSIDVEGFCPVCETNTRFVAIDAWLRDNLRCGTCNSIPRERALIAVLNMYFPDWRNLKVHESSPAINGREKLGREVKDYTASHFLPEFARGDWLEAYKARNEDLEHQTFDDETFDLVVTQDVFEHLFKPDLAISEIARTLKPGGAHICTVPLCRKDGPSVRRAIRHEDGTVEYLAPAVYHGSPIDKDGSLVTIDYGYDIADYFYKWSGLSTTIVYMDDLTRGIRAEYIEVLLSRKPSDHSPRSL